jgi:hypothetical protein
VDLIALLNMVNPVSLIGGAFRRLRRPRLEIYFDASKAFNKRKVVDPGGAPGLFCHLVVRSRGRCAAEGCQARLLAVADHDLAPHPGFQNPCVLKWSHEPDFDPREIEPDVPRQLDLCYTLATQPEILRFFTPKRPDGNQTDFPSGTYAIRVRVTSTNARAADGRFILCYKGKWDQIHVKQVGR